MHGRQNLNNSSVHFLLNDNLKCNLFLPYCRALPTRKCFWTNIIHLSINCGVLYLMLCNMLLPPQHHSCRAITHGVTLVSMAMSLPIIVYFIYSQCQCLHTMGHHLATAESHISEAHQQIYRSMFAESLMFSVCSAGSERGCEYQQVLRRSYVVGVGQTRRGAQLSHVRVKTLDTDCRESKTPPVRHKQVDLFYKRSVTRPN